ncbi:MAG: sensor histidine kinase [Bdellovibrionales bacterium]
MSKISTRLTFNQFFGAIILAVIVIYSGVATTVQIIREFNETKKAREDYQRVVSNLLISSLQAPLIQGSFVEAKIRANSSFDIPQVACVEISTMDRPIATCEKPIPSSSEIFEIREKVYFDEAKTQLAGNVRIVFDNSDIYQSVQSKILAAVALNLILALGVLVVLVYAGRILMGQLRSILMECSSEREIPSDSKKCLVISEFDYLRNQMAKHMAAARMNAETRAAGEIARQVKHDIRSPLAALNMLVKSIGTIGEDRRTELFGAIQRINDIANDLTQRRPPLTAGILHVVEDLSGRKPENIAGLVTELVDEKELQFKDRSEVHFELNVDLDGDAVFANVCSTKLKRALSNVLDNSVEAISGNGSVSVDIKQTNETVIISIVDTGKGIAPEYLSKLGQKGMTFNKAGGTGLGLYYANKTVNEVQGSLTVNSDGISGTSVVFEIPKCAVPVQHFAVQLN